MICVAGFNDPGRRDVSGSHDRRRDEYDWGLLVLRIRVKCAQIWCCSLSHVSQDRETVTRILRYFISKVQYQLSIPKWIGKIYRIGKFEPTTILAQTFHLWIASRSGCRVDVGTMTRRRKHVFSHMTLPVATTRHMSYSNCLKIRCASTHYSKLS